MNEHLNFRIKKYPRGWVSEIRKPKWTLFGIKWVWTHYISVSGISEEPWFFKNRQFAEDETINHVRWQMLDYDNKSINH